MMSSLVLLLIVNLSVVFGVEDSDSLNTSNNLTTTDSVLANNHSTKVTQSPKNTPELLEYVTSGPDEDYYEDEEPTITAAPPAILSPCLYSRCDHLSLTCEEIQSNAGGACLCPGIDGPSKKPDPPHINQLISDEREMTVKWCSPLSTVHSYRVLYQGPESPAEKGPLLNSSYRLYSIGNLRPNTQYAVCVVAINRAGESYAELNEAEEDTIGSMNGPCRIFHTNASKQSYFYLGIGLGLGALAVVLVVLGSLLCIRQKRNRSLAAEEGEMGIPNQSYKAGSRDYL